MSEIPAKPQQEKPSGPERILGAQFAFANNLECLDELFGTITPILKEKDETRAAKLKEMMLEETDEQGKVTHRLRRRDTYALRDLLGHIKKIFRADIFFRQSTIVSLITKFDEFLVEVLKICYEQNPGWLKGSDKKLSYKEVLEIKSLDAFKAELISDEIEHLMRGNHLDQIRFLDEKLKLGIVDRFSSWLHFVELTERRNLFVHTGGVVSASYIDNCKRAGVQLDDKCVEGTNLFAEDAYISKAVDCLLELTLRIAQAACRRLFPEAFKLADEHLIQFGVDLLRENRVRQGLFVFKYAWDIPPALRSTGDASYFFLVNLCLAKKMAGEDFSVLLHSVDWAPLRPKYHFAVAILERRFADAVATLNEVSRKEIPDESLRDWPLLYEFRLTDEFRKIYLERCGEEYANTTVSEIQHGLDLLDSKKEGIGKT